MTDFNSINPDKKLNFNAKKQNKGGSPDPNAGNQAGNNTPADPYAELKTDPGKMLNLMATQGKQNIQGQIESPSIERSISAFTGKVSPERHAHVTKLMAQTYQTETGRTAHPALLQDMVDNYLIGQPSIQS